LTPAEFNQTYDIVVGHNDSGRIGRIASALSQMWKETLGVDVRVESQEWKIYLRTLDPSTPIEDTFHIWRLGWCGDYPDAHNWLHEVFNFEVGLNRLRRNCIDAVCTKTSDPSRFDELTFAAAAITDPAERARLYAEAEDVLAREEAAYIPLYYVVDRSLVKPWLTWNFPAYGAHDFYNWRIDATAQQEARGE
jgi:oligopeptide transport system substrate-binding protein